MITTEYCRAAPPWWTGLDLYNHSATPQTVNGFELPPWGHHTGMLSEGGMFTLDHPPCVYPIWITGINGPASMTALTGAPAATNQMRALLIPYAVHDGKDWTTEIVLANRDAEDQVVAFSIQRMDGSIASAPSYPVDAGQAAIIRGAWLARNLSDPTGRMTIRIDVPPTMIVRAMLIGQVNGQPTTCSALPIYELPYDQALRQSTSTMLVQLQSGPWISMQSPNDNCLCLQERHIDTIQMVARAIFQEFPNRNFRELTTFDATPCDGSASPEHPGGSHQAGRGLDIRYYTMTSSSIGPATEIWTNGELNSEFDAERNRRFFELYLKLNPGGQIRTHSKIIAALGIADGRIVQDDDPAYHHDTHAHLTLYVD